MTVDWVACRCFLPGTAEAHKRRLLCSSAVPGVWSFLRVTQTPCKQPANCSLFSRAHTHSGPAQLAQPATLSVLQLWNMPVVYIRECACRWLRCCACAGLSRWRVCVRESPSAVLLPLRSFATMTSTLSKPGSEIYTADARVHVHACRLACAARALLLRCNRILATAYTFGTAVQRSLDPQCAPLPDSTQSKLHFSPPRGLALVMICAGHLEASSPTARILSLPLITGPGAVHQSHVSTQSREHG